MMWTGTELTAAGPSSLQNPLAAAMYGGGTGHLAASAQDPASSAAPAPPQRCYELQVVQHPDRCRTCSSDRDRRPMDPPPVLQVFLYDGASGALLTDPAEYAHLVVQATLWNPDLTVEWTTWNKAVPSVPQPPPVQPPPAATATMHHASPALITPASSHASTPVLPAGLARGTAVYAVPPPPVTTAMAMNHDMFDMAALFDAAMGGSAAAAAVAPPPPALPAAAPAAPSPATPPAPPAPAAAADTTPQLPWSHTIPPPTAQVQFLPTAKRCLLGNTWSSCFHVRSRAESSNLFYFVFPDLGIGADGQFRLQFELVSLGGMVDWDADGDEDEMEDGVEGDEAQRETEAPVLATAVSDVFTAYSPKKFPGMMESTELTNFLRKQGIKIPTRTEGRGSRGDADGEDAPPPRRASKRARTRAGAAAAPAAQDEDGTE
ncbi:hypothetical protein AMAG_16034 [Allomyces macrogynus ATCC 38327]|uniref:Velvet domain-containing protein n=1 Tax=Allomyces macrogynus (strain ATCC 38327) TaxID=578462 RepID=A0A0L0TA83_ALLM3|nr:hypothetical protein AMAG_16034 [Allomyces macrogynus ATCC 38327]|eukprot:KNE71728.1 hypothetical protein AMAG_16034 [Allomyces macrogynus ATCC 38327]